ncbi:MAG: hypothetical protein EHM47_16450, partial [Ignavibacteriales bacterium]
MILKFFFILITLLITLNAQQEEKVVVKIGSYKIYESEFRERFDFSVHPKLLQSVDKSEAKLEFLKQLIAEKLLSLHAKEKGYDTMKVFSDIISPLEDMFVRDQLYTNEIKNKVKYSPEDISEGLERIKNILKVKFLYSEDKKELEDIYLYLKSGSSFDSILTSRIESSDQE